MSSLLLSRLAVPLNKEPYVSQGTGASGTRREFLTLSVNRDAAIYLVR